MTCTEYFWPHPNMIIVNSAINNNYMKRFRELFKGKSTSSSQSDCSDVRDHQDTYTDGATKAEPDLTFSDSIRLGDDALEPPPTPFLLPLAPSQVPDKSPSKAPTRRKQERESQLHYY